MGNFSDHDEYEDLANPRPRKQQLLLLAALVGGLLVLGVAVLAFFLSR